MGDFIVFGGAGSVPTASRVVRLEIGPADVPIDAISHWTLDLQLSITSTILTTLTILTILHINLDDLANKEPAGSNQQHCETNGHYAL
jgi:hypothetical protein